jgi:hypothetical protein
MPLTAATGSASVVVTTDRFRDNRRGKITVEIEGRDFVSIVVTQPPADGAPGTTTRITFTGETFKSVRRALVRAGTITADEFRAEYVQETVEERNDRLRHWSTRRRTA